MGLRPSFFLLGVKHSNHYLKNTSPPVQTTGGLVYWGQLGDRSCDVGRDTLVVNYFCIFLIMWWRSETFWGGSLQIMPSLCAVILWTAALSNRMPLESTAQHSFNSESACSESAQYSTRWAKAYWNALVERSRSRFCVCVMGTHLLVEEGEEVAHDDEHRSGHRQDDLTDVQRPLVQVLYSWRGRPDRMDTG